MNISQETARELTSTATPQGVEVALKFVPPSVCGRCRYYKPKSKKPGLGKCVRKAHMRNPRSYFDTCLHSENERE